jgi:hypothetical protein
MSICPLSNPAIPVNVLAKLLFEYGHQSVEDLPGLVQVVFQLMHTRLQGLCPSALFGYLALLH